MTILLAIVVAWILGPSSEHATHRWYIKLS